MKAILGLDSATATASVAAARDGQFLAEEAIAPDPSGRPRHSAELLEAIELCADAAGGWDQVGRIAVGVGPGSFTGLRIGIATARALAQGHACEVVGVGSLAALAAGIAERTDAGRTSPTPVAVIDARRGQVFGAIGREGPEADPAVLEPAELATRLGRDARAFLVAGDGAVRFRSELEAAGATVPPDEDPVHLISARHICALGAEAKAAATGEIEPLYLREPDADVWRKRDRRGG